MRHIVACAGASTCRLGICLSRGLAKAVAGALAKSGLAPADEAGGPSLHISGCPNACGRHPVASIGLLGAARRVNGRLVPHYVLQLGGHVEEGKTVLASGKTIIAARSIPVFLVEFLRAFQTSAQYPDFASFLDADGRKLAEDLAKAHSHVPDFEEDKNFYFDWGAPDVFSLAGRGPGERGAGVFDLIEVDLASAAEALAAGQLCAATVLGARALLVTRGEQADTPAESLRLFQKHFVETGLVPAELSSLIAGALNRTAMPHPESDSFTNAARVRQFLGAVRQVYEGMGPSLRIVAPTDAVVPLTVSTPTSFAADLSQGFRGVVCPLNWVKTKMALGHLKAGQTLSVLLDEEGAQNVPASATNEGHEVISISREVDYWRLIVRKNGGRE